AKEDLAKRYICGFDHGVNIAINKVREALGDSPDKPRFIETLPRRGYRFIAPVDGPKTSRDGESPGQVASSPAGSARAGRITWRRVLLPVLLGFSLVVFFSLVRYRGGHGAENN